MTERKLVVATSTRADGNMGFSGELGKSKAFQNRKKFLRRLKLDPAKLVYGRQAHGAGITVIHRVPRLPVLDNDGFITNIPGIILAILHADCLPVFFYTKDSQVIGIAHTGWRGVVKGIIPRMVKLLVKTYRIKAREISAELGPAIQKCHFEIKNDVLPQFNWHKEFIKRRDDKIFVDLAGIAVDQLIKTGVRRENILNKGECTFHLPRRYFSYRRDKSGRHPQGLGNMLSYIALK